MRTPLLLPLTLAAACAAPGPSSTFAPSSRPASVRPARPEPPEPPAPPERVTSVQALGCEVLDAEGEPVGVVKDLLVDAESGALARIGVHREAAGELELAPDQARFEPREGELVLVLVEAPAEAEPPAPEPEVREPETLAGVVDQKALFELEDGTHELRLVVRGPSNHYHRATLGRLEGLKPLPFPLDPGQEVLLRGHYTRDVEGRLFRVRSVSADDATAELLPVAARASEPEAPAPRSLAGVSVETADGGLAEVAGFELQLEPPCVPRVWLRAAGAPRAVDWSRLAFDPEGGWTTDLSLEVLRKLEAVGPLPIER